MTPTKNISALSKYILFVLILFSQKAFTQEASWSNIKSDWSVSIQAGSSILCGEVATNLQDFIQEMTNQPDFALNFQIEKTIFGSWNFGFEGGKYNYRGYNTTGEVNWLTQHYYFNNWTFDYEPHAIYYDSDIINYAFYFKYNFKKFHAVDYTRHISKVNLYTKLSVGMAFPSFEIGYIDTIYYNGTGLNNPIYEKGRYIQLTKDSHFSIETAIGVNYEINDHLSLSLDLSAAIITVDDIDGAHNFNEELTPNVGNNTSDYRVNVYSLSSNCMLGISYSFNLERSQRINPSKPFKNNDKFGYLYSKFFQKD